MSLQIKSLTDQMRIIELDKKKLNNKLQDAMGQNNELTSFIKSL
jgi:chaperonin cofactor prefoldin